MKTDINLHRVTLFDRVLRTNHRKDLRDFANPLSTSLPEQQSHPNVKIFRMTDESK
ncbi:hypothetical protein ALC57_16987 [Trachymyrmex cornetzi]|uniref:Uncharacterized protein n=1 Tax=Trachymyrmex cornetzi TaxID=471704 RepID=A0A151ITW4_9HYME|nr:hypothetical protein ALC57_16987 [Trachymyrmex cornetzi]